MALPSQAGLDMIIPVWSHSRGTCAIAPFVLLLMVTSALVSGCGTGASAGSVKAAGKQPLLSNAPQSVVIGRFTQVFSPPVPAGARQQQVIAGFREAMVLWSRSEEKDRLVPPVTEYVSGTALRRNLKNVIANSVKYGITPIGQDRMWDTQVSRLGASTAVVTTCDDGSKFSQVYVSSGKKMPPAPENEWYLAETYDMTLISGHWSISNITIHQLPDKSADRCQL